MNKVGMCALWCQGNDMVTSKTVCYDVPNYLFIYIWSKTLYILGKKSLALLLFGL